MSPQTFEIGPLEMEVLGVLQGRDPQPVAAVQGALKKSGKDLAYTTVMTVLVRLEKKRFLKRTKDGRQFLYSLSSSKDKMPLGLFEKVGRSLFKNDRLKPILALLEGGSELTAEELKELRRAVDEKLRSKNKNL